MSNSEIADHFSLLSKLFDIHGENSFKSKSYSSAAYTIDHLGKEVADMSIDELYQQRGIGQSTGEKILQLLKTGEMKALQDLLNATPPGIVEMLHIKGLGPKKINAVWKELGIEDVGELEYACTENRLVSLKGFGAKTQQTILEAIGFYRASQGFHLWAHIEKDAIGLLERLRSSFPGNRFELTGAIRRQEAVVENIEIVTDATMHAIEEAYGTEPGLVFQKLNPGQLIMHVPGEPAVLFIESKAGDFFKTLFISSAAPGFSEAFVAKYSLPDALQSEEEIFTVNGLPFVAPALRESAAILDVAVAGKLPGLIQPTDIKGIIHSHSKWSDGASTIEEMAKGAIAAGYEYLVISDHSQAAQYAGGLSPEQIIAQHAEVDALNTKLKPFRIFKSIEADILSDGALDYDADVLKSLDLVIASVHSNLSMSMTKAMDRLLAAISNPLTTILGHPTGRLLLSRKGYPVDHKILIDACAANKVVIEINANPRRLDIDWRWISYAMEQGVLLSIDPDAHSIPGFHDVYYGVKIAQKGGLTKEHNLSSFSLPAFENFLKSYDVKAGK